MKRPLMLVGVLLFGGWGLFAAAGRYVQTHGVYNGTASEPIGNYLYRPLSDLRRGGFVLACMPANGVSELRAHKVRPPTSADSRCLAHVVPLVKNVVGLPGDSLTVDQAGVHLNGRLIPETRPLPGWGTASRQTVPKGHIFVLGRGPDSFDSRYFGSVVPSSALMRVPF